VDSRPRPPRRTGFFAARFGAVFFDFAFFFDFLAGERRFGATDLLRVLAAGADFRALAEPFPPFFRAAVLGAFFAIAFSLTKGL
jgi:hypothetical protein